MVRYAGCADRAEEDRVVMTDLLQSVGRHHRALVEIPLAGPVELVVREGDAVPAADGFEDGQGGGHDLAADAVAGDEGDSIGAHAFDQISRAWPTSPLRISPA